MLRKVALVGAVAFLGAASVAAGGLRGGQARVSMSNASAGARPVALSISLPTELRCGRITAGSLILVLPRAMRVPRSIARGGVRVSGRVVGSVGTKRSTVVVRLMRPTGSTCYSIVRGVARLQFTRRAGLGNPLRAGSFGFTVEAKPSGEDWRGSLVVHS
jgi:hypothetical protein